jgi:hypothetical protein
VSGPATSTATSRCELEQVAVQQEEPRQAERANHPQLLVQARRRLTCAARCRAGSGVANASGADLGELRVGGLVLGARVAVAEVAGEVEGERLRQALGLGDRVGMVGEARHHRVRRREDMGVVAAPQRL